MKDAIEILKWYQEMGVDEAIDDNPTNHFELYKIKKAEIVSRKSGVTTGAVSGRGTEGAESVVSSSQTVEVQSVTTSSQNRTTEQVVVSKTTVSSVMIKEGASKMSLDDAFRKLTVRGMNVTTDTNESGLTSLDAMEKAQQAADEATSLQELEQAVRNFDGCAIKKIANNTVFSRGNPKAEIMIIGEAPGNNEDLQGVPFCGQSGMLLDNMLKAMGWENNVYVTNTLFWRPPGNRCPTNDELESCRPFVEKHIALIAPKLIIAMGATAMKSIIDTNQGITKTRGLFFDYSNHYLDNPIKATALFHPSYLLRQSTKKRDAWKDWLVIEKYLKTN